MVPKDNPAWEDDAMLYQASEIAGVSAGGGTSLVRTVYFDVPLHPGNLTLAEMFDGSFRVMMNDEPLPDCHWPATQIRQAVDRFQRIKSSLAPRGAGGQPPAAPRAN
jgi:hypothetical protein